LHDALPISLPDGVLEVLAGTQRVGVPKDLVRAEPALQFFVHPAGVAGGILAAVADEDGGHRGYLSVGKGSEQRGGATAKGAAVRSPAPVRRVKPCNWPIDLWPSLPLERA